MKTTFLPLFLGPLLLCFSCDSSETVTDASATTAISTASNSGNTSTSTSSTSTINNTTIQSDTEAPVSEEMQIINAATGLAGDFYEGWQEKEKLREANEPNSWVYLIGNSYDDDELAAMAYDRLKQTEDDIYIFKKKRKKYYLIKGIGLPDKEDLEDSLTVLRARLRASVEVVDLSKMCRKLPINTSPVRYRIDGEKKRADCKTCE